MITAIACCFIVAICFEPPTYYTKNFVDDLVNIPATVFKIIGVCVPAAFFVYVTRTRKRSQKDATNS